MPFAKLLNSKTPIGPFHKIVLALLTTTEKFSLDCGPASKPCQSLGIELILCTFLSPLSENSLEHTTSTGRCTVIPFCFAFSRIDIARSNLSSSHIELPMFPPKALIKVKDIPPPIIISSTLLIMLLIIGIFEETFAPPKIAKIGFFPVSRTLLIASTSLESKWPENLLFLKNLAITVVEA